MADRIPTAREIELTIRAGKPGRTRAGDNLYVQIARGGTATWMMRYQLHGRPRDMGLGSCGLFTLAEAREIAHEARRQLARGVDPIDARKADRSQAKLDAARSLTFRSAAEQFIEAHRAGWRHAKSARQWESTLATHAFPVFGDLPVAAIDTALVLRVLEPIWSTTTETAVRLRGRIESVLDWAGARGYRTGDNPARWRGHLDKLLPARSKVAPTQHYRALPYRELPAFMAALRGRTGLSAKALQLTVLTAARSGEVLGATWPEINLAARVWTIPGNRTKSGREHRVPLSNDAVALLQALPRVEGKEHLFPGNRPRKPLDRMAMVEVLRGLRPGETVHGFRSTFRDWASETTGHPNHIVEMALAHAIGDKVEAAYRRGDLLEKRRRLMGEWAAFCNSTPRDAGAVVPIRG